MELPWKLHCLTLPGYGDPEFFLQRDSHPIIERLYVLLQGFKLK